MSRKSLRNSAEKFEFQVEVSKAYGYNYQLSLKQQRHFLERTHLQCLRYWGALVDVVGFCFLNLGTKYQPQKDFTKWIQQGSRPLYIGFGSMPVEDGGKTMSIILEALEETGQRGIIVRGWGYLGLDSEVPEYVYLIDDCPHDWLFPQCTAVIHHGGAGTTATGLRAACPTTLIPFFGDQFFWGERIQEKGVGLAPIPIYELNVNHLSDAIRFMLDPEIKSIMKLRKNY